MTLCSEGPNHVAQVVVAGGSAEENEEENSHNKTQQEEPGVAPQQQRPSTSTLSHRRPNPYLPSNIQKQRMALKSQHAVSVIKACKKKGSSFSWSKSKRGNAMNKSSQQSQTCRVCQAKALNRKIPKRVHHPNGKHNRAFKNSSRKAKRQQDQQ